MQLIPYATYPYLRPESGNQFGTHGIMSVMVDLRHAYRATDSGQIVLYESGSTVRVLETCGKIAGGKETESAVTEHHSKAHGVLVQLGGTGFLLGSEQVGDRTVRSGDTPVGTDIPHLE